MIWGEISKMTCKRAKQRNLVNGGIVKANGIIKVSMEQRKSQK